jgi:hypothetical protein
LSADKIGSSFFIAFARSCSVQMIGLTVRLSRLDCSSSLLSMLDEFPGAVSTNTSMSLPTSSVFAACEPKMKAAFTPGSARRASPI